MCMAYPPTIHLPLWVLSEMDWSCLDLDWQLVFPEPWLACAPNDRCANTYKPGDKRLHVQKTGRQTARLRVFCFFFPGCQTETDGHCCDRCAAVQAEGRGSKWCINTLVTLQRSQTWTRTQNRWILLHSCNYSSTEQQCFQSEVQRFETNMNTTVAISQHAATVSVTKYSHCTRFR